MQTWAALVFVGPQISDRPIAGQQVLDLSTPLRR
jgi:hypothetical protein